MRTKRCSCWGSSRLLAKIKGMTVKAGRPIQEGPASPSPLGGDATSLARGLRACIVWSGGVEPASAWRNGNLAWGHCPWEETSPEQG